MTPAPFASCTLERYERDFAGLHLLHGVVTHWAARRPREPAIISHDRNQTLDWASFEQATAGLATQFLSMGLAKGDYFATSLPLAVEHILLEYACFRIGVIHAPLDLRLPAPEVLRCLNLIGARAFAFLGQTPAADFRELGRAVQRHCPTVRHFLQFCAPEETIEGATPFTAVAGAAQKAPAPELRHALASVSISPTDPAQVIFTTGSTGAPKPALLSHRSITCQNLCLATGFDFREGTRVLVNLPPSHVGCQAETLMTTLFGGGTAVILAVFDAARSLEAIAAHRVHLLGQIPAMLQLEWRQPNYASFDLSSLETAVYGGQQVSRSFLDKLATMAPRIGTGLGLTEASGFCTYTLPGATADEIESSIGFAVPAYPLSIREPMREDGSAGAELPAGEAGQICFRGPQTFLGYVNDPAATARAISADGFLYTGDLGFADSKGLHFCGREKWVIKPVGYQVYPGDVENHFCRLEDKVASCGAVGVEHKLLIEAIVAFVEKKPGADLSIGELKQHSREMASFQRPLHYVLLEPGQMPLNRAAKADYLRLEDMAAAEIATLRAKGRWD